MNKRTGIILFGILSLIMGACAGAVVWAALKLMDMGIRLIWETIPEYLNLAQSSPLGGGTCGNLLYDVLICLLGGLLIGLWQKRHGIYPESLEEVMATVKNTGGYQYHQIHVLLISALLPLIFGGAIGPEAGLTGVIAGLCTLIGDKLKYRGDRAREMAEAGFAAVLGVVFQAPLFGIINNLEPSSRPYAMHVDREPILSRAQRTGIYIMAVAGAMLTLKLLASFFGGMSGLPRFDPGRADSLMRLLPQWKWAPALIIIGILVAILQIILSQTMKKLADRLSEHRVISCLIAGLVLGLIGHFYASGRFSGEEQMEFLMGNVEALTASGLMLLGLVKLLMVNICISLGWKGGSIFPMIYSGVAIGYASASILSGLGTSIELTFAVAIVTASMLGFLMRKPITVLAILLLCFPLTYLPALLISALLAAALGRQLFHITKKQDAR